MIFSTFTFNSSSWPMRETDSMIVHYSKLSQAVSCLAAAVPGVILLSQQINTSSGT